METGAGRTTTESETEGTSRASERAEEGGVEQHEHGLAGEVEHGGDAVDEDEAGDEEHAGEDADEAGRNLAERDVQSTCGGWAAAKVWGWAAAFLG